MVIASLLYMQSKYDVCTNALCPSLALHAASDTAGRLNAESLSATAADFMAHLSKAACAHLVAYMQPLYFGCRLCMPFTPRFGLC